MRAISGLDCGKQGEHMAHSKKHTVIVRLLKGKVPEPDQVIMGTFANPREWLNPAKAACATAGFEHLNAFTVNTVCNSGLVAAIIGDAFIKAGAEDCVMAGGMENLLSLSDKEIL